MTKRAEPWKPGQSGNPKGRPKGRPDRRTALREALSGDLPAILATLTKAAKAGDVQAAALILSRCLPPLRATATPSPFALPKNASPADAARAVVQAVAAGDLTPDTGRELLAALAAACQVIEHDELERRIAALEQLDP